MINLIFILTCIIHKFYNIVRINYIIKYKMPRVQGSKGFTNSEIRLVLKEILTVLPRSAEDWKKVYENCKTEVSNFNFQHPDRPLSFRKQETLRRKYSDMIALSKKKDSNLSKDNEIELIIIFNLEYLFN